MSKYIDLLTQITRDKSLGGSHVRCARDVVEWLDEHPDQVPGRTITESEFNEAYALHFDGERADRYEKFLRHIGITVVPDPEPTNAEKWEKFIRGTHFNVRGWTGFDATKQFAEILDKQGVKAPGSDDD